MPIDLTPAQRRALDRLLPPEQQRENDLIGDLIEAIAESLRIRRENSDNGGHMFEALHEALGSWDEASRVTGIPASTIRRWARPPTMRS